MGGSVDDKFHVWANTWPKAESLEHLDFKDDRTRQKQEGLQAEMTPGRRKSYGCLEQLMNPQNSIANPPTTPFPDHDPTVVNKPITKSPTHPY